MNLVQPMFERYGRVFFIPILCLFTEPLKSKTRKPLPRLSPTHPALLRSPEDSEDMVYGFMMHGASMIQYNNIIMDDRASSAKDGSTALL